MVLKVDTKQNVTSNGFNTIPVHRASKCAEERKVVMLGLSLLHGIIAPTVITSCGTTRLMDLQFVSDLQKQKISKKRKNP